MKPVAVVILVLGCVLSNVAVQAQAPNGNGASSQLPPRIQSLLASFQTNPAGFLERAPEGGGLLMAQIRDVLVGDTAQLNSIFALIPQATAAQQEAIGSGLALARLLLQRDVDLANEIQARVVAAANPNLLRGFAIFGGTGLAALGGGLAAPPPSAPIGPVGNVAGAPASNSQGRGGSGAGGDTGGLGGAGSGGLSAQGNTAATGTSN